MLQNKKKLKGMTLVETIVALAVIVLVTIIAYVGVNTSARLTEHGADIRNADGPLVSQIEEKRKEYYTQREGDGEYIDYKVQINRKVTDYEGEIVTDANRVAVTEKVREYEQYRKAVKITAASGQIEYDMYLPYLTIPPPTPSPEPEPPEGPDSPEPYEP